MFWCLIGPGIGGVSRASSMFPGGQPLGVFAFQELMPSLKCSERSPQARADFSVGYIGCSHTSMEYVFTWFHTYWIMGTNMNGKARIVQHDHCALPSLVRFMVSLLWPSFATWSPYLLSCCTSLPSSTWSFNPPSSWWAFQRKNHRKERSCILLGSQVTQTTNWRNWRTARDWHWAVLGWVQWADRCNNHQTSIGGAWGQYMIYWLVVSVVMCG